MKKHVLGTQFLALAVAGAWALTGCGSDLAPQEDPTAVRYAALGCAGTTLSATNPTGNDVSMTAAGTCTGGTEYLYWAYNGTSWTVACNWKTGTTCDWTAPAPGVYKFVVNTRSIGGASEGRAETAFIGVGGATAPDPCTSATAAVSGTTPSLTVAATASCGTSTPQFRYWAGGAGSWIVLCNWTTDASCPWDTTGLADGPWRIVVEARGSSIAGVEARAEKLYNLGNTGPCSTSTVSVNPTSGVAGTSVTITAGATCGGASVPQFDYWARSPTLAWSRVCPWTTDTTCTWNTTGLAEGTWTAVAVARQVGAGGEESRATTPYSVIAGTIGCSGLSFVTNPVGTGDTATNVTVTSSATCNGATATYQTWARSSGGTWNLVCAYKTAADCVWNPSTFAPGNYTVVVEMRELGSYTTLGSVSHPYVLTPAP